MRKSPMGKKRALAGVLAVLVLGAGIFLLWRCARPQSPVPDLDTLLEMEDDELLYALETHSLVLPPSCAGNREEAARLIKILLIRAREKGVGDTHYQSTEWIVFSTHLYWTVGIPLDIDQADSPP